MRRHEEMNDDIFKLFPAKYLIDRCKYWEVQIWIFKTETTTRYFDFRPRLLSNIVYLCGKKYCFRIRSAGIYYCLPHSLHVVESLKTFLIGFCEIILKHDISTFALDNCLHITNSVNFYSTLTVFNFCTT